jgi:hypothetical protein
VLPTKVRFFRGQMTTIISRALTELGIKPMPSRRCFSIMSEWHVVLGACNEVLAGKSFFAQPHRHC